MQDNRRKLTDEEMKGLDGEYKLLVTKLETQLVEQIVFLRKHIAKDPKLPKAKRNALDQLLEVGTGMKLALFRITDANVLKKNEVQVTYEFHDDLYAYLRQADSELPKELRGFLDGGTVIDASTNKNAAEDLSPLTGKTKTGVPKYDALLANRNKPS